MGNLLDEAQNKGQKRLSKTLRQTFRQAAGLLDWILQKPCPLCDRLTASNLCPDCWKQVDRCQFRPSEHFLGNRPPQFQPQFQPQLQPQIQQTQPMNELRVFAWGAYSGALKRSIAALKYQNQPQLAEPLGDRLATAWSNAVSQTDSPLGSLAVIPIPLHAEKLQQRGFNQAERLAAAFCDRTGLPLYPEGLIRVRSTEAQFRLDAAARQQNLVEAFQVGRFRGSAPSQVLLIDDIYTTGATAKAAVQALQQQKITVWGIVVLARA